MSAIMIPPDIARIFDQPGRLWTPDERRRVREWLWEPPQLSYLLLFTLRQLHKITNATTEEDAEDTWADFDLKRLDSVINSYDPAKGKRFWEYLLFCLERFCHDEGEKIRRQQYYEKPIKEIETEDGEYIEIEIIESKINQLEQILKIEEVRVLENCLNTLPDRQREVSEKFYFFEMKIADIAKTLSISKGAVKAALFNARHNLAECLGTQG